MDLLDRLLGHDAWTTRELLIRAQPLTDEQLDREFAFAHHTVRATFLHILRNMEAWTDAMFGRAIRPRPANTPEARSVAGMIARLDAAAPELARVASAVRDKGGWDEVWADPDDDTLPEKSFGGTIAHVITHSMHHRGQLIPMLRALGVPDVPEGDALYWEYAVHRG
ncbi:MAG: DinB family protein [Candidatus Eisenbacteria bacterium]